MYQSKSAKISDNTNIQENRSSDNRPAKTSYQNAKSSVSSNKLVNLNTHNANNNNYNLARPKSPLQVSNTNSNHYTKLKTDDLIVTDGSQY